MLGLKLNHVSKRGHMYLRQLEIYHHMFKSKKGLNEIMFLDFVVISHQQRCNRLGPIYCVGYLEIYRVYFHIFNMCAIMLKMLHTLSCSNATYHTADIVD